MTTDIEEKKSNFLKAFRKNMGNVTHTGKSLGIKYPRDFLKYHRKHDPEFARAIEEIKEEILDGVESELYRKIFKDHNTASIIFYLKCHGKERGWIEKQQIEGFGENLVINIEGVTPENGESKRVRFQSALDVSGTGGNIQ